MSTRRRPPADDRGARSTADGQALDASVGAPVVCIARGASGDCCILCGRVGVELPDEHGCMPDVSRDDLVRVNDRALSWDRAFDHARQKPRSQPLPQHSAVTGADGAAALEGLVRFVLESIDGTRNTRLHWAACRAGEHVAAGRLPDRQTRIILARAAAEIGLPSTEASATIASGMSGGVL